VIDESRTLAADRVRTAFRFVEMLREVGGMVYVEPNGDLTINLIDARIAPAALKMAFSVSDLLAREIRDVVISERRTH
jgi:hypothetical protein